ncbi:S-layer homology domain-containing protein [Cohnella xylanilytica]|uniref:S-layer homology domain-containing protein n=1 Tax=Cohnella xylanilytica TaxID=557555 RepID=A0A841TYQ2_9BACL|nr:S-layer homology domain-containing protein [Cohnella xylanilytica]MBB6690990.1 S-layer homology domain-containing protein [Cohnella xylanilytica]
MKKTAFVILILTLMISALPNAGADRRAEAAAVGGPDWYTVGSTAVSEQGGWSSSLQVEGGIPYVAYTDLAHGKRLTVRTFDRGDWKDVGSPGFSAGEAGDVSMKSDGGTLYAAYQDGGNGNRASVMKYDGTAWEYVGAPGFSAGNAQQLSLYIDNGTLYVAYQDGAAGAKATVMRFDGTAWINVGNPGFTPRSAYNLSLAVDNGQPYLAFQDYDQSLKASVMTFDGSDWVYVGGAGLSGGKVGDISFLFYKGAPHIAYMDSSAGLNWKATVMAFDGTSWAPVGSPGFSAGGAQYIKLAVSNGELYAGYQDDDGSDLRATVMKYDGAGWTNVGRSKFTAGDTFFNSLYADDGTPFMAYMDKDNEFKVTVMYYGMNELPEANSVAVGGVARVGQTLTGSYVYSDAEYDREGASAYRWYAADDASGTGKTAIAGATGRTLTLTAAEVGKYITFAVTPVALSGEKLGAETESAPTVSVDGGTPPPNAAPTAGGVSVGGTAKAGETLTGNYTYADAEGDAEGASAYRWYAADDASGTGKTAIAGATGRTLTLTAAEVGKYVSFAVTPVAATGTSPGAAVESAPVGPVAAAGDPVAVPAAPANLKAKAGSRFVTLQWDAATGAESYNLYQGTATGIYDPVPVATVTATERRVTGLTNGTTYYYIVKAANEAGESAASNEASARPTAPVSSAPSDPPAESPAVDTGVDIWVNDESVRAGIGTKDIVGGQSVAKIAIDEEKLKKKLAEVADRAVVTIPFKEKTDVAVGELSGALLRTVRERGTTLVIKTGPASYTLPSERLALDSLAERLGAAEDLSGLKVQFVIAVPTEERRREIESALSAESLSSLVPPVTFTVQGIYGERKEEVSSFDRYVKRAIAIPQGTGTVTTAVAVDPDGRVRSVPTQLETADGQPYARILSMTNGTYALVNRSLTFSDVAEGHWARGSVNDMASRLVVEGTGGGLFEPNREITRAEFAAMLARGLGLRAGGEASPFPDVPASSWYGDAIRTAAAYKLVDGFEDGTFGPLAKITREQAMAMVRNAMDVTGLSSGIPSGASEDALSAFADAGDVSAWARNAVADNLRTGIAKGRYGKKLAPKENITRAEAAELIENLLRRSELI